MSKPLFCLGSWKLNSSASVVVQKLFRKCNRQLISKISKSLNLEMLNIVTCCVSGAVENFVQIKGVADMIILR